MVDKAAGKDEQVEHIGTGGFRGITWILGAVVVVGGAVAVIFFRGSPAASGEAASDLVSLRASMASVCKDEQFAGPTPAALNQQYLESSRMQGVIAELNGQFKRGPVDCAHVVKTLKSVSYPLY